MANCVFLHADDDDAAHQMLQIAIEDLNIPVELYRTTDGEQTLAFLRKGGAYQAVPQPDLLILDLYLPKKSGRDVLAEMRRDDALSGMQTVVFTSSSLSSERREVLALGAEDYIVKPSTFKAFLAVVRSLYSRCTVQG
jgi:two-component system, chemotaxis family, response regulator Rcp1